jgi:YHYH protein
MVYHESSEKPSLDTRTGQADPSCTYHYHAISKLAQCTHDQVAWDNCELIGYALDRFPMYLHCFIAGKDCFFLTSCYALTSANATGACPRSYLQYTDRRL